MPEIEMKFAWVPPGSFLMGSNTNDNEKPVHRVTISKGFYMAIFPVTQMQWCWVMGSGNRPSHFQGDECPVESVTWDDCQPFCARMRELTGKPIRLPTEAEWEYACRAGTTTDYSTGNGEEALKRAGWYQQNGGKTHPVGKLAANLFGLFDMHGNVWEWCQDWYGSYSNGDKTDPIGDSNGDTRVVRGGSWYSFAGSCRAAYRYCYAPPYRANHVGLRVCFSLD